MSQQAVRFFWKNDRLLLFGFIICIALFLKCKPGGEIRPNGKTQIISIESLYNQDVRIKEVRVKLAPKSGQPTLANFIWVEGYSSDIIPGLVYASKNKNGKWVRTGTDTISIGECEVLPNRGENLSQKFQDIVDFAANRKIQNIFIPRGTYVLDQVFLSPGLRIFGEKGSEIKKIPNATKSSRIFTTQKRIHSSNTDSAPLIIENLSFDGNRLQQGAYTEYQLEHQAIIFLYADKQFKGRLKATIKDCQFRDGVGDAISVYTNVDATILNCSAYNVFRGGVTITGGYTKVLVNNFKAGGDVHPTGIDVEVSGPGYNDIYAIDIEMNDLVLDGDCDIGVREGQFVGNRITCLGPPFNFNAKGGKILIKNSTFIGGRQKQSRIQFPKDITFENCTFRIAEAAGEEKLYAANVIWSTKQHRGTNQKLTFTNCVFERPNGTPGKSIISYGLYCHADPQEDGNVLKMEGCYFKSGFDYGLYLDQGGNVIVDNTKFDCANGVRLWSVQNAKSNHTFSAELSNLKFKPGIQNELEYTESESNNLVIKKTPLKQVKKIQKNKGQTNLIEK